MAVLEACPPSTPAAGDDGQLVEHLHQRIAELTEAVAARDAFISVAGHDLRNAMTPIMGQVDLLMASVTAGRCSPQQMEQRLERVQRTMIRYVKRARVLLDVSQLTGGRLQFDAETFDLAMLLRGVVNEFQAASRRSGASVQVAAPEGLMVTLDHAVTEQIVSNLVHNALRHGAGTSVDVSATVLGQQVCIQVRNHGRGFSASDRSRLFGRFERAMQQDDRNDGVSVGLWVAGQFVAAMGGTVGIDEASYGEPLLTVTLPLHMKEVPY